jgi:hypothetical protein
MDWLNRVALVVTPKRRFFDWVNGLPDAGAPLTTEHAAAHRMVYLAVAVDPTPVLNEVIEVYWEDIFEEALEQWILDDSFWPANRTQHVFRDWFHVDIIDGIVDMDPAEPLTIRELARTRCAYCDAELGPDTIVVAAFTDSGARRMTVEELESIQEDDVAGDAERPRIVFRCCGGECARQMEEALERSSEEDAPEDAR